MALIWDDVAVVSVGMSCQAAHQILMNRERLDALVGAPATVAATPLDWLIAPPAAAAAMVRDDAFFPPTDEPFAVEHEIPVWRERGALYWHERAAALDPAAVRAKFAHTTRNFARVLERAPLLVFTNLQTNLDIVAGLFPTVDPVVRRADVLALEAAVAARSAGTVYYALAAERVPDPTAWPADRTLFAPLADSEWKGDKAFWREALPTFLARHRART